jgi:hypothetical protein
MNSPNGIRRDSMTTGLVRFRLVADRAGVEAELQLRSVADRWFSVSVSNHREVTGIGSTARAAIVASLGWLGPAVVSELLADLVLLDVSRQLRELSAS